MPAPVTRGARVAHRYTYAPPRCTTLQSSRTFIPFSVSLWNDLANPVFDGVGLAGFKSRANSSLLAQAALSLLWSSTLFPFLFFLSIGWYCGAGVFGLIRCISLSLRIPLPTFFNNTNNNILTINHPTHETHTMCIIEYPTNLNPAQSLSKTAI